MEKYGISRRLLLPLLFAAGFLCCRCDSPAGTGSAGFTNPVSGHGRENTSVILHDGRYYLVESVDTRVISVAAFDDLSRVGEAELHPVYDMYKHYGLEHIWHPQMIRVDGVWYIYFTADDGNTDNHQLYVIENPSEDPLKGTFTMSGRIATDPDGNWAIHGHVFRFSGRLYMVWSGWESRRVFEETQSIYLARMKNPRELAGPRVKISEPVYEWERQCIGPDGITMTYPIFVNESPVFFDPPQSDSVYIYYSASAHWTPYQCVGALSASRDSDLTDPLSWHKSQEPVFRSDPAAGVYGPGSVCVVPSPDGSEHYLLYVAKDTPEKNNKWKFRTMRMQKIEFGPSGEPQLGTPVPLGKKLPKPSGTR